VDQVLVDKVIQVEILQQTDLLAVVVLVDLVAVVDLTMVLLEVLAQLMHSLTDLT
jgi:hypothetical protein